MFRACVWGFDVSLHWVLQSFGVVGLDVFHGFVYGCYSFTAYNRVNIGLFAQGCRV